VYHERRNLLAKRNSFMANELIPTMAILHISSLINFDCLLITILTYNNNSIIIKNMSETQ